MIKTFLLLFVGLYSVQSLAEVSGVNFSQNPEIKDMLKMHNYEILKTFGFMDTDDLTAVTALLKNKDDKHPKIYLAKIQITKDGKDLIFKTYENCVDGKYNADDVINVDGTNVQAQSGCGLEDSSKSSVMVYIIKTNAGKKYVIEKFRLNEMVKVRFKSMIIPFDASEFIKAWDNAGEPAL